MAKRYRLFIVLFFYSLNSQILAFNEDRPSTSELVLNEAISSSIQLNNNSRQICMNSSPPDPKTCEPLDSGMESPRINNNRSSRYWAQDMIGADLAKESLEKLNQRKIDLKIPKIGILDAGFDPARLPRNISNPNDPLFNPEINSPGAHGNKVTNLIFDPFIGVAYSGKFIAPAPMGFAKRPIENFLQAAQILKERKPQIINVSYGLGYDERVLTQFQEVAKQGSIFVFASGNNYPLTTHRNNIEIPGIRVGNLGEDGFPAQSSQEDDEIDILAPAGNTIESSLWENANNQKLNKVLSPMTDDSTDTVTHPQASRSKSSTFGGTSAAAPLVTGTIANLISIIPDLSLNEARAILKNTAQLTVNSYENPRKNGAGTLNAFKAIEVAKRLRENKNFKRADLLNPKSNIFNFQQQSENFYSQSQNITGYSCHAIRTRIHLLRKAFLLDGREEARRDLIRLFELVGLTDNANFLKSIAPPDIPMLTDQINQAKPQELARLYRIYGKIIPNSVFQIKLRHILSQPNIEEGADAFINYMAFDNKLPGHQISPVLLNNIKNKPFQILFEAVTRTGQIDFVKMILNKRPQDTSLESLSLAGSLESRNPDLVLQLISSGIKFELGDKNRESDLHNAIYSEDSRMVQLALKQIPRNQLAQLLSKTDSSGNTPLISSIRRGDETIVRLLLNEGANPSEGLHNKKSPADLAHSLKMFQIHALLCQNGGTGSTCPTNTQ